jgi:hypothetical protein
MSTGARVRLLEDSEREALRAFADALIPGGAGLPSASEADVHGKWIDRTLRARPDLAEFVAAVLRLGGEPEAELDRLRRQDAATFDGFTLAVSASYFMNPRVRRLLGYPGNAPKRKLAYPDEADYFLDGGKLLQPVVDRGPIYRPTPGVSEQ